MSLMSQALIRFALIVAAACMIFLAMTAQAAELPVNREYPPMPEGVQPGNVNVYVAVADTLSPVADAYIAITDATGNTFTVAGGEPHLEDVADSHYGGRGSAGSRP